MLAPRNVCFISVKFLYIPEQTFSSFPNCLKNNPLQPSLSPKQKKFSFSEKHLVFSNVWISINNPRFPLHKDINNCSTLKPPCLRFPEWGEWERRHQWGSLQGDPCWDRGGAGQRWLLGPRGMQELFGWVEDLHQRGFLMLFGVLSSQLASWTVNPAWLGHGLERVILG